MCFTICKGLTTSVLCFETMLVWSWTGKSSLGYTLIEFLVDDIYVRFGGQLCRQMVGIPMGTNCAPLWADLFLYSYENEFLDKFIKKGKRKLARKFNLSYRYIDDLISFNNKRFKWVHFWYLPQRTHNFWNHRIYFNCFLSRSTSHPRQTWCIWLPYCELSLHVKQYSNSTSLWCLCTSAHSLCPLLLKL